LDTSGDFKWGAGDTAVSTFTQNFPANLWPNLVPFIWTKKVGASCQGVIGFAHTANDSTVVWVIDLNGTLVYDVGDAVYSFKVPGTDATMIAAPIWSTTHQTTVMAVFQRSTGNWYVDKNNNKTFDNCVSDSCTGFGAAFDLPFTNSNSTARGVSRYVQAVRGFNKIIDGNSNGVWDVPGDGSYSYYVDYPRAFIW
jgi:hypothetical protein